MDPILLVIAGLFVAWVSETKFNQNSSFVIGISAVIMLVFYFVSIGMFVNLGIFQGAWSALGAQSGTEYMINGIILPLAPAGISWTNLSSWTTFSSIFLFVLYPFWLWLGYKASNKISIGSQ